MMKIYEMILRKGHQVARANRDYHRAAYLKRSRKSQLYKMKVCFEEWDIGYVILSSKLRTGFDRWHCSKYMKIEGLKM
jgi:hypothetical protein